jgi:hypothetical protein
MPATLPEPVRRQVELSIKATGGGLCIVDIRAMAAEIRERFPAEDIALPDIAETAIRFAGQCGIPVELSGPPQR